jgi:hypothetical protein
LSGGCTGRTYQGSNLRSTGVPESVSRVSVGELRRRQLRHPSSVAVGTDVVLLAGGRRAVQMARLLVAQTEGNEWSLCARTDGIGGLDEPSCPRNRSVGSDLEIVVMDRSPSGEWRVGRHANFLGLRSAAVDLGLLSVVHDTRQSSHVQQAVSSAVRHAKWRTLRLLRQMMHVGTAPRADVRVTSRASMASLGVASHAIPAEVGRSVCLLTVQAVRRRRFSCAVLSREILR